MKRYDFRANEFSGMLKEELERMVSAIDNRIMPVKNKDVTELSLLQVYELVAMKMTAMVDHVQRGKMSFEVAQKGIDGEFKRGVLIIYNLNVDDDGGEKHTPTLDSLFKYIRKNILDLVEVTVNTRLVKDE